MVKLIIWDLDDTLWNGTLAEGDNITPFDYRVECIKTLTRQGVVNSICSKNDRSAAARALSTLGIYDLFVFNEIAFEPKGPAIQRIISDMNLRAPDVTFIDDNVHNRKEVESLVPGIVTLDPTSPECDQVLSSYVAETAGGKSRLDRYRTLESKRADRLSQGGSNIDFLRSCEIKMCIVGWADNLSHADRIEELINRTNQLNFTKSRVRPGEIAEDIVKSGEHPSFSAFVWDRYGNYGLVGFAMLDKGKLFKHLTFSCRVMNMGIEKQLVAAVTQRAGARENPLPVNASDVDWIELVDPASEAGIAAIQEATSTSGEVFDSSKIRVMANCQSASIAHYMRLGEVIDFDNYPRVFTLSGLWKHNHMPGSWRETMVYGAFVNYDVYYWPNQQLPTDVEFRDACEHLVRANRENSSDLVVILPTEKFTDFDPERGRVPELYATKNDIWRDIASEAEDVRIVEIGDMAAAANTHDPRHYSRELLIEIADKVRGTVLALRNA